MPELFSYLLGLMLTMMAMFGVEPPPEVPASPPEEVGEEVEGYSDLAHFDDPYLQNGPELPGEPSDGLGPDGIEELVDEIVTGAENRIEARLEKARRQVDEALEDGLNEGLAKANEVLEGLDKDGVSGQRPPIVSQSDGEGGESLPGADLLIVPTIEEGVLPEVEEEVEESEKVVEEIIKQAGKSSREFEEEVTHEVKKQVGGFLNGLLS